MKDIGPANMHRRSAMNFTCWCTCKSTHKLNMEWYCAYFLQWLEDYSCFCLFFLRFLFSSEWGSSVLCEWLYDFIAFIPSTKIRYGRCFLNLWQCVFPCIVFEEWSINKRQCFAGPQFPRERNGSIRPQVWCPCHSLLTGTSLSRDYICI
jgi:hypothetical protein